MSQSHNEAFDCHVFYEGVEARFRISDDRDHIQSQLLTQRAFYEQGLLDDVREQINTGDLVLDVGANIGNHTVFFSLICGAKVIALEPHPQNYAALQENVRINGLQGLVRCMNVAAGENDGRAQVVEHDPMNMGAVSLDLLDGEGETRIIRVDDINPEQPVALIKIDVEGMELSVLRGAESLITENRPIVYVEVGSSDAYQKIASWMAERGFVPLDVFNYTPTVLFVCSERITDLKRPDRDIVGKFVKNRYGSIDKAQKAQETIHSLREELGHQKQELKAAQDREEAVLAQYDVLHKECERLNMEVDRAKRDLTNLENKKVTLESDLRALEGQNLDLKKDNEALERSASKKDEDLSVKQVENERLQRELQETQAAYDQEEVARTEEESERKRLSKVEKRLTQERQELQAELRAIKESRSWRVTGPIRRIATACRSTLWKNEPTKGGGAKSRSIRRRGLVDQYRAVVPRRVRLLVPRAIRVWAHAMVPPRWRGPPIGSARQNSKARVDVDSGSNVRQDVTSVDQCSSRANQGVSGLRHQSCLDDDALVSVIMTTYNSAMYVERSVRTLLDQSYKNIELIIVDDASTDSTFDVISEIANTDNRVRPLKNFDNRGTYWCKNLGILESKGDVITFQDSDDQSQLDRIEKQVEALQRFPNSVIATCNYVRCTEDGVWILNRGRYERVAIMCVMFRTDALKRSVGYFDAVRTSADAEIYHRVKLKHGKSAQAHVDLPLYFAMHRENSLTTSGDQVNLRQAGPDDDLSFLSADRRAYVTAYKKWHDSIASGEDSGFIPFPLATRRFSAPPALQVHDTDKREMVTASVASFPAREGQLRHVISSIMPQVDRIYVYLNNYEDTPEFLADEKIHVASSKDHGDQRDNGKFFFVSEIEKGFHVVLDDDIHYPEDYVAKMLVKSKVYGHQCALGVHGVRLARPMERFYEGRNVSVFWGRQEHDWVVHLLGTGTVFYSANRLRLSRENFGAPGMADVWFAAAARRQGVPLVSIARDKQWLKQLQTDDDGIYNESRGRDDLQTDVAISNRLNDWDEVWGRCQWIRESLLSKFSESELRSRGICPRHWSDIVRMDQTAV